MKIIYIAGPFRAPTSWEIEQNVRKAEEIAFKVIQEGAMPLCPHANTRFFHGSAESDFFIQGYLEILHRCDAIMMIAGYSISEGSIIELKKAKKLGMPIFMEYEWGVFIDWLKEKSND